MSGKKRINRHSTVGRDLPKPPTKKIRVPTTQVTENKVLRRRLPPPPIDGVNGHSVTTVTLTPSKGKLVDWGSYDENTGSYDENTSPDKNGGKKRGFRKP